MAEPAGTLESLALAVADLVASTGSLVRDELVLTTFESLGVSFPAEFLTDPHITPARRVVENATYALAAPRARLVAAVRGGAVTDMAAAASELAAQCGRVNASLVGLKEAVRSAGPTLPGISQAQIDELTAGLEGRIVGLSLARAMDTSPVMSALYHLFGVVERTRQPGDPTDPTRPPHDRVAVHLDRILPAVTDPAGQFRELYGWGTPSFDAAKLLAVLELVLLRLGIPAVFVAATATTPPLLEAVTVDVRPTADGAGLGLELVLRNESGGTGPLEGLPPSMTGTAEAAIVLPTGAVGEIRPPFTLGIAPPGPARPVQAFLAVEVTSQPEQPVVLIGQAGGSRLEIGGWSLGAGFRPAVDPGTGHAAGAPLAEGAVTGGKLVIDASSGDGFLTTVLGGSHLEAGFELAFAFAPETGLRFRGSGGLDVALPVHVKAGPLEIQNIHLAARFGGGTVPVELSADFSVALGPVTASVRRMGLTAELSFPPDGGNVGPVQLDFGFKAPNGIGLVVDAGVVTGGGFLYADPERGEYAGALELDFAGLVALKAIGVIGTRMPDRPGGFSLLILITTEFGGGGIQLGYGFTLLAVGGLLGLNRGTNLRALVEGTVTGRVESVMFPRDVVANAPRIISDLGAFFPPEQGTFLIGPMAKIGWGTPTLISVSLGVVIEIPGNLAVIGVLRCVLPTEQLPLLVIQVGFIGAIEFDKSRLWFTAALFDSRILTMPLSGGMGLVVAWGDDPQLVLSVGGFHPSYRPPPLPFPVPERLSIDILNQPGRLIRVSGYFAVTSNTVQFGARAELRLGFEDFGIEGHLGFDALFQFSPFAFAIDICAGVSLKAFGVGLFGIDLRFSLSGVSPWRANGRGSISLLFFEISADFDITWGEEQVTTLPPVEVLPLLEAEFGKTEGWETRPPPAGGGDPLVTLRKLPDDHRLVLHPLGTLFVRQRAIPLGIRIDRVGAQRPSDGTRFQVTADPACGLVRLALTGDKFAMAQFQDMNDADKLSASGYEDQAAGVELGTEREALDAVRVVRRSARYEAHVFDSTGTGAAGVGAGAPAGTRLRFHEVSSAVFDHLLTGSSTSRSPLSRRESLLRQPFTAEDSARVTGQRFVIAHLRNNAQAFAPTPALAREQPDPSGFRSRTAADDALDAWVAADPRLTGRLHVVPEAEAAPLAAPGTWSPAGDTPAAVRSTGADAVRLASGSIVVAGGADAAGVAAAAAALFDPVALVWESLPPLRTARTGHTVVPLAGNRVLVAGGRDGAGVPLASTEIYDPVARAWSAAGSLHTARGDHAAVPLGDGRILVCGGTAERDGEGVRTLACAELFDPRTGAWSTTGFMTDARSGHRAVLLPQSGRVLAVGGALATGTGTAGAALAYCELYDPATGAWTPAGSLATPRTGHGATVLDDGSVLVTGGGASGLPHAGRFGPDPLATAERYAPGADSWSPVPPMPAGRSGHRALLLRSGKVLVTGGARGAAGTAGFRSSLLHDPATGAWTATGCLAVGRYDFAAVELSDGRVLAVGGIERSGPAAPGDTAVTTATTEIHTP
ncbi:DUF6603 domain-containing protein [Streptomyces sp. NPDC096136]|uniref:DUF6603 domain-containing protein n=1 Tax=Streptomyces sp. NPDC096136 TaxID=3366076 RepID=UPI00380CE385